MCVSVSVRGSREKAAVFVFSLWVPVPSPRQNRCENRDPEWFTAPSCLPVSPCACCTGCRSSAACPTRWRWRRSSRRSSCGGSRGSGCRRRTGSGGEGSRGCRNHWEGARKEIKSVNPFFKSQYLQLKRSFQWDGWKVIMQFVFYEGDVSERTQLL